MRVLVGCSAIAGLVVFAVTLAVMLVVPVSRDESLGLGE